MTTFQDAFHAWQGFYGLLGSATATLIGLIFITVTLGVRIITEESLPKIRIFVTPTLVHFGKVMVIALLFQVPTQTALSLPIELIVIGILGTAYTISLLRRLRLHVATDSVDTSTWVWSIFLPLLCNSLILLSAGAAVARNYHFLDALAAAVILLVIGSIRNAWDATLYIARQIQD